MIVLSYRHVSSSVQFVSPFSFGSSTEMFMNVPHFQFLLQFSSGLKAAFFLLLIAEKKTQSTGVKVQ